MERSVVGVASAPLLTGCSEPTPPDGSAIAAGGQSRSRADARAVLPVLIDDVKDLPVVYGDADDTYKDIGDPTLAFS